MGLFKSPQFGHVTSGGRKPRRQADPEKADGIKCSSCGFKIMFKDREDWLKGTRLTCPDCNHHYPLGAAERIDTTFDFGSFSEMDAGLVSVDILSFVGPSSYKEKLEENNAKTGLNDAIVCGTARLEGHPCAVGVMDFRYMGGSMGSVVGEKVARLCEAAVSAKLPAIIFTASGGARMYEGMFSLMQMAKTSAAVGKLMRAGLPYIVVMTHPTTAGVTASFASLGDVILAEPGALIGFAGQRVIKDTTQAALPPGFQSAEFLLRKGMIDRVVHRMRLKEELARLLSFFSARRRPDAG